MAQSKETAFQTRGTNGGYLMKRNVITTIAAMLALSLLSAACAGEVGPAGPAGAAGPDGAAGVPGAGLEPQIQSYDIRMGEGELIQVVDGKDQLTGEFHRWEPDVMVVTKGDTVRLHVTNPRGAAHILMVPEFGVTTPRLEKRGGEADVEFVADKAGVFQYMRALPYDAENEDCDLDHKRQVGYLIVMER
jgi:hypothetical protein